MGLASDLASACRLRHQQRCRKRIEEVFGWIKTTGGVAQVKVRGLAKVQAVFIFAILAYNLVRIPKLLEAPT
jgi:IS5 family transposase